LDHKDVLWSAGFLTANFPTNIFYSKIHNKYFLQQTSQQIFLQQIFLQQTSQQIFFTTNIFYSKLHNKYFYNKHFYSKLHNKYFLQQTSQQNAGERSTRSNVVL
jgi:hypothetical protein